MTTYNVAVDFGRTSDLGQDLQRDAKESGREREGGREGEEEVVTKEIYICGWLNYYSLDVIQSQVYIPSQTPPTCRGLGPIGECGCSSTWCGWHWSRPSREHRRSLLLSSAVCVCVCVCVCLYMCVHVCECVCMCICNNDYSSQHPLCKPFDNK